MIHNVFSILNQYLLKGLSVIPVKGKKPLVAWTEFQKRRATENDLQKWSHLNPTGIGLITGSISGVMALDIDIPNFDLNSLDLPITPISKTGKGYHVLFEYPKDRTINNSAGFLPNMDIRGEGGYIVIPPSIHENGNQYEWITSLDDVPLAAPPQWLLDAIEKGQGQKLGLDDSVECGVVKGHRNDAAARYIGGILAMTPTQKWESDAWPKMQAWNQKNSPPLSERELRGVFDSISHRESYQRLSQETPTFPEEAPGETTSKSYLKQEKKGSQGPEILQMLEEENIKLFTDQMGEAYTLLTTKGKTSITPLNSKKFEKWLQHFYCGKTGKLVGTDVIKKVSSYLSAKADYESPQSKLHNRIAKHDGSFWYDLKEGKGVKIDEGSWRVIEKLPVLFRDYSHQKKQALPCASDGDINRIFKYVRIKDKDEQGLYATWLVACFVPGIPHPVLNVFGEKGAAKSSSMRATKEIIDPSRLPLLTLMKDQKELVQQLSHHYAPFFDNVRKIKDCMSDLFCGAVTGTGTSKRRLYTDDDTVIYSFQRCIGFNGINNVAYASDLLDRSLQIQLSRIPKYERKTEEELKAEFLQDKPFILGGIFDALAKARTIYPSVKLTEKPRMADFAKWGYAIAEATGFGGEDFLSAYEQNMNVQNEELLESDPVAQALESLMESRKRWEGTPYELYKQLGTEATHIEIDTSSMSNWPRAANALTRHLNEIKSNLIDAGITFHRASSLKGKRGRLFVITSKTVDTVEPSQAKEDLESLL
jgi:hypothetical protein